ncbi:hypothetical protein RND81_11G117600 [Saponaria officinalis]|uniref:SWIM-type domain-containing protein n=1 Tax=Saponaria officinalis TaxID=3572 RepID=A0AAW1HKW9_SAPOF
MNKGPVKYGSNAKDFPVFLRKVNVIVWDEDLEADEFDSRWAEIMAEYGVGPEREWFQGVFKIRRQWVMAHFRSLKMASVLRTTQRSESENNFFKKFENNSGSLVEFWMRFESAIDQQRHTQKKLDNDNRHSSPKLLSCLSRFTGHGCTRMSCSMNFNRSEGTYQVTCTCMKFERSGMLCRHIISIFSSNGVNSIPDYYLARRWCKDEVGTTYENEDVIDGRQIEMTNLWSEDLTKEQEIEQLLGYKPVDEIKILPLKHAKNKGSGKRMLSNKTLALSKAVKPKRMCNNCKQMAHHDKRSCPNPYAELLPPTPDSSSDEDDNDEEVEEDDDSE